MKISDYEKKRALQQFFSGRMVTFDNAFKWIIDNYQVHEWHYLLEELEEKVKTKFQRKIQFEIKKRLTEEQILN